MLTYEQAITITLDHAVRGTHLGELPIEQAVGQVLAEEIVADIDMPAFNRAAMDGFAFRHADHRDHAAFRIAAAIAAGEPRALRLGPGECIKIMTGAAVPEDADTVVPVEETSAFAGEATAAGTIGRIAFRPDCAPGSTVTFENIPPTGSNIAPRGQDLRRGQVVLRSGALLQAQEIAMLAAVGRRRVKIHAGPAIAFGATGEELVEPEMPLAPGKIRNSNAYSLWAQVLAARAEPHYIGIIPDREEALREGIATGLQRDMLVLSGGISMGERDLVPRMLLEAGVRIHFRKLRVRPGRPVLFGTRESTLVFGLPGNPISTLYAFDLYVLPAVRVFRHHPRPRPPLRRGRLAAPVRTPADWLTFVACRSEWRDGEEWLTPRVTHGSADIFAIGGADVIALVPVGTAEVAAGTVVDFWRLFEP